MGGLGHLCGDVSVAMMVGGALFTLAITIALVQLAVIRSWFRRRIVRQQESFPLAFITPDAEKLSHESQLTLPKCSVVMPVKGVHDQSYDNWRRVITSMYGGPLAFFFCVEAEDDPAYAHIQRLQAEMSEFDIQLLVAGRSWHCSQKIHNQLHGFNLAMRTSEYVIVVDDDIKLHPGTIRRWVEELESDPRVLAASGYAFEYVPVSELNLPDWFWMLWRLSASSGFSDPHDRPANCWGGAMMFRSSELRRNVYGLIDAWRDGGYASRDRGLHMISAKVDL